MNILNKLKRIIKNDIEIEQPRIGTTENIAIKSPEVFKDSENMEKPLTIDKTISYTEIKLPKLKITYPKSLPYYYDSKEIKSNNYRAYFRNGELYDLDPNPYNDLSKSGQIVYDARYIISDGIEYDLKNKNSIDSIKIPDFGNKLPEGGVTSDLAYILKMRANCEYNLELAISLVYKSANLMIASNYPWSKQDYYRIVKHLWEMGETEYADYLLNELKAKVPIVTADRFYFQKESFEREMELAKSCDSDYWFIDYDNRACEICAKYQNRIYSFSGKDKRFPKLPDFIKENGCIHKASRNSVVSISSFEFTEIKKHCYKDDGTYYTEKVDPIEYSNREFIDNRTEFEIKAYEACYENDKQQEKAIEQYCDKNYWLNIYKNRLEYQEIVNLMGENAPKSYSGYRRMKKNNTTNYQKIKEMAINNGIHIE